MGVRQSDYAKEFEKQFASRGSFVKAHETAVKKASVAKQKEEALIKKVKRMLKMIYYGKRYHEKK